MVPFFLQILLLPWMLVLFKIYMSIKYHYTLGRTFQVTVLMYSEVAHCICTILCSYWFRFPNIKSLFSKCTQVMRDLIGAKAPLLAKVNAPMFVGIHLMLTIYRCTGSLRRTYLLIPYWIGMNQVMMIMSLLYLSLSLVDMSLGEINKDLDNIRNLRARENGQFIQIRLILLRQRHSRAISFLKEIRTSFGPDVFFLCFFFLFKLTFICYHLYYKMNLPVWDQNPLIGKLSGYFLIMQLVVCLSMLAYVCDGIYEKVM